MKKLILGLVFTVSVGVSSLFAAATFITPMLVKTDNSSNVGTVGNYVYESYIYDNAPDVTYNNQAGLWVTNQPHSGNALLWTYVEGTNLDSEPDVAIGGLEGSNYVELILSYAWGNGKMYVHRLFDQTGSKKASGRVFTLYHNGQPINGNSYVLKYNTHLTYH